MGVGIPVPNSRESYFFKKPSLNRGNKEEKILLSLSTVRQAYFS